MPSTLRATEIVGASTLRAKVSAKVHTVSHIHAVHQAKCARKLCREISGFQCETGISLCLGQPPGFDLGCQ